jgi:U3 small nucleolar RNA-associated protein 15
VIEIKIKCQFRIADTKHMLYRPVHVTKFSNDSKSVISGSDDKTLRVWDVSTSDSLNEFSDHTDYIRAGLVSAENPNLIVSGSYDQTVKLWDMRSNSCVMTMNHGAPVEDVLMYPGGGAIVSAGGTSIKVWDLLSGGRAMHSVSNHQKTITSMCFDGSCSRLLTGSLDQHVKIYNVMDYKVVHSIKYPSPVMSVGISPTDSTLAVGMATSS